jgi:hypothetical protein
MGVSEKLGYQSSDDLQARVFLEGRASDIGDKGKQWIANRYAHIFSRSTEERAGLSGLA